MEVGEIEPLVGHHDSGNRVLVGDGDGDTIHGMAWGALHSILAAAFGIGEEI